MAATNNPFAQYQQNAIMNAKPEQLLIMLFTGAVKFIKQADQALERQDLPGAHNALVRAQSIISHLRETLDTDHDIAHSIDALYDYIYVQLVEANLKKDRAPLAEAGKLVEELRETWMQAVKNDQPQESPAANE